MSGGWVTYWNLSGLDGDYGLKVEAVRKSQSNMTSIFQILNLYFKFGIANQIGDC